MLPSAFNFGGNEITSSKPDSNVTPHSNKDSGRIFYGWIILGTGFFIAILAYGFYYSFGVFFGDLQNEFAATRASIALIASIMNLSQTILGLATGWAVDKYGPRLTVGIGGLLVCGGLVLSSRASSVMQLYIFLGFVVGCGVNAAYTPYIITLARWFVKLRGLAQGILVSGVGVGMMIMSSLSIKMLANYGWRTTFIIMSIIGVVVFGIAFLLVRKNPQEKGLKPYGMMGNENKINTAGSAESVISMKKDQTLKEAMKTRDLYLIMGVMLTMMLTIFMVSTHLVNYAKDTGISPANAALLMTIIGAVSIIGRIVAGFLTDRIGTKKVMTVCTIVITCLMVWLSTSMSAPMFRVFAIIYGLSYGGATAVVYVLVPETFGVTHMGKIFGFIGFGGAIGGVLGPWLAGYVFDTTGSYSVAFLIAAGSTIAMTIFILLIGKTHSLKSSPK